MDQIAAAANTSKPVIYRYFADKDDLYRAVGERVIGQIVATLRTTSVGDDPRALLHASIDAYLQLLDDNPQLFRFVTQHRLLSSGDDPGQTEYSGEVSALLTLALGEQLQAVRPRPAGRPAVGRRGGRLHPRGQPVVARTIPTR